MLRTTLRSLLARKLRLLLSGFAVVLGVSFVSGTFVLTDTLGKVFDELFAGVNGTSVTVRGVSAVEGQPAPPVDVALLDQVRAVEGVAEAVGNISGYAEVVVDGEPVAAGGAPSIGVVFQPDSSLETLELRAGQAPSGPDEVAIDKATADRVGIAVGDQLQVSTQAGVREVTVSGTVGFGDADSFAGAALTAFDLETAQAVLAIPGTYSDIAVAAQAGVDDAELASRIDAQLPEGVEAVTGQQSSDDAAREIKEGLGFFTTALLVFAGISLFVGAFLIFNTFSMLVAQRARELALLRALGASRRQVTGSVLVEALVIGVVASLIGFGLGIAVAVGLRALLGLLGIDLPSGDLVLAPRTLVACLVVGVGVTAVAALVPARRAARVAPVEAMRESGPAEERSLRRRGVLGGLAILAGVGVLALGLALAELPLVGVGVAVTFLGVATVSPLVARPVASVLAAPFARLGVPGRLGRANAVRSPPPHVGHRRRADDRSGAGQRGQRAGRVAQGERGRARRPQPRGGLRAHVVIVPGPSAERRRRPAAGAGGRRGARAALLRARGGRADQRRHGRRPPRRPGDARHRGARRRPRLRGRWRPGGEQQRRRRPRRPRRRRGRRQLAAHRARLADHRRGLRRE
jgi:putative ABC transport system permease protein